MSTLPHARRARAVAKHSDERGIELSLEFDAAQGDSPTSVESAVVKQTTPMGEPVLDQKFSINLRDFQVAKSETHKREIVGVAMVANEIDSDGDLFTIEAVEGAAAEFVSQYNISKDIGQGHTGARPDVDMIGSWYTETGATIDDFVAPKNSWFVKLKVNDDAAWEQVTKGEITGLSIEGSASGYNVTKIAKSENPELKTEDEATEPKRIFTSASLTNLDIVNRGANLHVFVWKAKDHNQGIKTMADPKTQSDAAEPATAIEVVETPVSKETDSKDADAAKAKLEAHNLLVDAVTKQVEASMAESAAVVEKAKTMTPSRKDKLAQAQELLNSLASEFAEEGAEAADPAPVAKSAPTPTAIDPKVIAEAIAKATAPLLERLERVETARQAPNGVQDDSTTAPVSKNKFLV